MSNEFKTPGWLKVGFAVQTVVICVCLFLFIQPRRHGDVNSHPMFDVPPLETQANQHAIPVLSDKADDHLGEPFSGDRRSELPMHGDESFSPEGMTRPVESAAFEPPHERMEDKPPIELHVRSDKTAPKIPTSKLEDDVPPERAVQDPLPAVGLTAVGGDAAGLGGIAIQPSVAEGHRLEPEPPASPTRRFYEVQVGSPTEVATTIRELFSASAKVSADSASRSVIVIAQETTHEQVTELINEINDRAQSLEKERLLIEQIREEELKKQEARQREAAATPDRGGGRSRTDIDSNVTRQEGSTESSVNPRRFPADESDSELDRQAKQLAQQLRTARPTDRQAFLEQLRQLTQRQFQHRQERREVEFDALSQRLDQLKDSYRRRQERQAEIIERRINDLLDPNADLHWDSTDDNADRSSPAQRTRPGQSPKAVSQPLPQGEESQYDGRTYSQWLKTLEIDQNPARLLESLIAISHLLKTADHQELSRAVLRMIRKLDGIRSSEAGHVDSIFIESLNLLARLSPAIVVDNLIQEIPYTSTRGSTRQFFDRVLDILAYPQGRYGRTSGPGTLGGTAQITIVTRESIPQIQSELAAKSHRIVTEFVVVANRGGDPQIKSDMMSNAARILTISKQPLASYPDLVPIADEIFDHFEKPQPVGDDNEIQPFLAAILFAQNNYRFAEVLEFAERFTSDHPKPSSWQFTQAVQIYVAAAPQDSIVADRLGKLLETRWSALQFPPPNPIAPSLNNRSGLELDQCFCLIRGLSSIGASAIGTVKLLTDIGDSMAASKTRDMTIFGGEVSKQYRELTPTLAIRAKSAAEKIIEADKAAKAGATTDSGARTLLQPAAAETTYDGITYSQWLKLLETERKPEKLIAAIETCARLVVKGDERKVTHLIFVAESVFENEGWQSERNHAANIGWYSLSQLPGDVVADEMLVALRDHETYQKGRSFQAGFFSRSDAADGIPHQEIVLKRANEMVAALLSLGPETPREDDYELIAAAVCVWRKSGRPLSDFNGLPARIQQMARLGFSKTSAPAYHHWWNAMGHVAIAAPETPDLAINLIKQAQQHAPTSGRIVGVVRVMKRHAAPAVPGLVELFESEVKRFSPNIPLSPLMMSPFPGRTDFPTESSEFLLLEIVGALGDIGTGDIGYELLSALKELATPKDQGGGNPPRGRGGVGRTGFIDLLANAAKQAIVKFPTDYVPSTDVQLVSDYWKLNGTWQMTSTSVSVPVEEARLRIRLSEFIFTSNTSSDARQSQVSSNLLTALGSLELHYPRLSTSIDQSQSPKQIDLTSSIPRRVYESMNPRPEREPELVTMRSGDDIVKISVEGLYELNDDTLVIQYSKSGQPRPEKISGDGAEVPKDQFRLEFKRTELLK